MKVLPLFFGIIICVAIASPADGNIIDKLKDFGETIGKGAANVGEIIEKVWRMLEKRSD